MNYDLNIFDRDAYQTSGRVSGGWVVSAYTIPHDGAQYGSGDMIEPVLELTENNIKLMRLWQEDEDFWMDYQSLKREGRAPRRLTRWLEGIGRG